MVVEAAQRVLECLDRTGRLRAVRHWLPPARPGRPACFVPGCPPRPADLAEERLRHTESEWARFGQMGVPAAIRPEDAEDSGPLSLESSEPS